MYLFTILNLYIYAADASDEVLRQLLRATGGDVQLALEAFFDQVHITIKRKERSEKESRTIYTYIFM